MVNKTLSKSCLITAFLIIISLPCVASETGTLTIYYSVMAINEVDVNASTVELNVQTAPAGSDFEPAMFETSYSITTNCPSNSKKISASIDSDMPSGIKLEVNAIAPQGASSCGFRELCTISSDLVDGIDATASANIPLTFKLTASVSAGNVISGSRTVTITIANSF
jgi:hypothetical protein